MSNLVYLLMMTPFSLFLIALFVLFVREAIEENPKEFAIMLFLAASTLSFVVGLVFYAHN